MKKKSIKIVIKKTSFMCIPRTRLLSFFKKGTYTTTLSSLKSLIIFFPLCSPSLNPLIARRRGGVSSFNVSLTEIIFIQECVVAAVVAAGSPGCDRRRTGRTAGGIAGRGQTAAPGWGWRWWGHRIGSFRGRRRQRGQQGASA